MRIGYLLGIGVLAFSSYAAEPPNGKELFQTYCAGCHGNMAEGVYKKGPALSCGAKEKAVHDARFVRIFDSRAEKCSRRHLGQGLKKSEREAVRAYVHYLNVNRAEKHFKPEND